MSGSEEYSLSHGQEQLQDQGQQNQQQPKRKPRGIPVPGRIVLELSPEELKSPDKHKCQTCHRTFLRRQNLQMHLRTHNDFQKLEGDGFSHGRGQYNYICPEMACVHHDKDHALGDITAIKKHYWRKHCEKTHQCKNCSHMYALLSDLKQHQKNCKSSNASTRKQKDKNKASSSAAVQAKPAVQSSPSATTDIDLNQAIDSSSVNKMQLDRESDGLLHTVHSTALHLNEEALNPFIHELPFNLMEELADNSKFLSTMMGDADKPEGLSSYFMQFVADTSSASATMHQQGMPPPSGGNSCKCSTEPAVQANSSKYWVVNNGASSSSTTDNKLISSKALVSTDLSLSSLPALSMYGEGPSLCLTPAQQERNLTQLSHVSTASALLPQPGTVFYQGFPSPVNLAQPCLFNVPRGSTSEVHPPGVWKQIQ